VERPGATSSEHEELTRLRRWNAEPMRSDAILKTGSAFSADVELDRNRK